MRLGMSASLVVFIVRDANTVRITTSAPWGDADSELGGLNVHLHPSASLVTHSARVQMLTVMES